MRKVLLVLLVGLLLGACATTVTKTSDQRQRIIKHQEELIKNQYIKIGMTYKEVSKFIGLNWTIPLKHSDFKNGYMLMNVRNFNSAEDYYYQFEQPDETKQIYYNKLSLSTSWTARYKLTNIFKNRVEGYDYYLSIPNLHPKDKVRLMKYKNMVLAHQEHVAKQKKKKEEEKRLEEEKKQIKISSIIDGAKSACKGLGFKEETEKFNDCAYKLYTKEIDKIATLGTWKNEEFVKTKKLTKKEKKAEARENKQIAEAMKICRKIGATPGTDKFIDCTIKLLTTSTAQQTVIVGNNQRRSIYPLHCRQMGGASAC